MRRRPGHPSGERIAQRFALLAEPGFGQAEKPIEEISRLSIGSRPTTRRGAALEVSHIRAIPWVFSWMQSRFNLPGWYGLGTALTQQPLAVQREMYDQWPFFRTLLDNAEVSLAKTDLGIAAQYAGLVRSRAVRDRIFGLVRQEYDRSVASVLKVTQRSRLLENQRVLAQSIRRRNPDVDPLNYLQIRFLARWRKASEMQRTEALRRLLALTVHGIAFGMKSTG